jgi:murein DD-endopeptidase MepM/ murein hydrolase activator NlpD
MRSIVVGVLIGLTSGASQAPRVTWAPDAPRQGTLFRLNVSDVPEGAKLTGAIAGEPLHFSPNGKGGASALAPIPIDSLVAVHTRVIVITGDRAETTTVRVPVTAGAYRIERLTVAPRFGEEPDSALSARLRDEAARARAVAIGSHETPRLWSAGFLQPRRSRITSPFGGGRQFNGRITSRHMGTDFAGQPGDSVRAANRGVVRLVDRFYLGGNVIYLDHGEGLTTAYLHLSKALVAPGDTVRRGQAIGRVGATGRVTGPHLHFIARYGTVTVDPMSLFGQAVSGPTETAPNLGSAEGRMVDHGYLLSPIPE